MLTQSEREWLEHRDAMQFITGTYIADFAEYPLWNSGKDWQDAAEFEARVAAKLAEFYHHTTLYLDDSDGQKLRCWETCPARFYCGDSYTHLTCGDAVLKTAQLAVEKEMDAENG